MQKILGIGTTGLVGARVSELLKNFEINPISRASGVDITDHNSLEHAVINFEGKWVLHMAAKADVDGCEDDKKYGHDGNAWIMNVLATENIAKLCKKYDKKLIYISTDFVFDGQKPLGESYNENDSVHAINWYGETKMMGEVKIAESGASHIILRIAYPYGISSALKKDFVRIIGARLKDGKEIRGVTDHIMCPTYIDDVALAIEESIDQDLGGIYHAVGSEPITPYDAALLIAEKVGASKSLVSKTTRDEYFVNKAKRPLNLYLNNDKIKTLGVSLRGFSEGLSNIEF